MAGKPGGNTRAMVLHACQKLETQMKQDAELAEAVQQLCARLKGGSERR